MRLARAAACLASACLAACGDKAPSPEPAPPQVTVVTVVPRDLPLVSEQVGQAAGFRETEVRSRVQGILLKRLYREGQSVNEGDPLFQLDPEPFKAALDRAQGNFRAQEVALDRARADRERIEPLFAENAVSRKDMDDARSAHESAQAAVDAARAQVREAEINLGYTLVRAPIAGVVGREARSEGNLVAASGDASLLTVISQLDPLYVNFSFSEVDKLQFDDDVKSGRIAIPADRRAPARAKLADGRVFAGVGHVDFADSRVDPRTGTIRARAEFPNPEGRILPGQFVRLGISLGVLKDALAVPERAVTQQQATRIVLAVNERNVVEPRRVTLGRRVGDEVVLLSGVKPGDRVIVDGIFKARPGSAVAPVAAGPAAAAAPVAPAAPAAKK